MAARKLLTWQCKHVRWFLAHYLKDRSEATRYYYQLTAILIWQRMGKPALRITM